MAEKALTAVIKKAYVQCVSTGSVDDLVKVMGSSSKALKPFVLLLRGPAIPNMLCCM